MRKSLIISLTVFLLILVALPAIIVNGLKWDPLKDDQINLSKKIKVYINNQQKTVEIPIDEYLIGVVAAEMPAKFEKEALKAQAVAARTYTLKRLLSPNKHEQADICTDFNHCQAWESISELKKKWGPINYYRYIKKIKEAVLETKDEVIEFNGTLIDPVYHSSCGGVSTENSEEVWGSYQPYLHSVRCTWDENNKKEVVSFNYQELGNRLFGRDNFTIKGIKTEPTSSGRIRNLTLNNDKISAIELRKRLGLKSTIFTYRLDGQKIYFTTVGNGHGVGMCQYGANGMAKKGIKYKEILKYYYHGVVIVKRNKV